MVKITHMSTREVARVLACTPQHIARLVRTGELSPAFKMSGRTGAYLFDAAEVARYKDARAAHKSK